MTTPLRDPVARTVRRARPSVVLGLAAMGATMLPSVVFADEAPTEPTDDEQLDGEEPPTPSATTTTTTTTTVPTGGADDDGADGGAADDPTGSDGGATSTATPGTVPVTTLAKPADAPPAPVGLDVRILPDRIQHVLATIRYLESRNTYDIAPNAGNASGAYQFIASTWQHHGGYPHAYLAPPPVQDERAAQDVIAILERFDGDVSMVPVMWYYPRAVREPALMDVVPKPEHGNKLTIREYQTRWMSVFAELSGEPLPPVWTPDEYERRVGLPPTVPRSSAGVGVDGTATAREISLAYPVLGPSRLASLECANDRDTTRGVPAGPRVINDGLDRIELPPLPRPERSGDEHGLCVERAPGVVFGVKLQPVLAAADGVVTAVDDEPGSGRPISVVVTSIDGTSIEYRGFNDDSPGTDDGRAPDHLRLTPLATVGTVVRAGQIIGFMGDSDPLPPSIRADVPTDASQVLDPDESAPHVRLTITDRSGRRVDAVGPLLDARHRETCRVGIGGWSMPPSDGPVDPITIETTDVHDDIDSDWEITATGQVVATGWAAMINPVELCGWVPADGFGPGANGSTDWLDHWLLPYELPTELWVELSLRDDASTPDAFVMPA